MYEYVEQKRPSRRSSVLYRWGVAMAKRRRLVLSAWALLLIACAASFPALENRLGGMDFGVRGSESSEVQQLLRTHFPQFGVEQDVIVFQSGDATADTADFRAAVERATVAAQQISGVCGVVGPYSGLGGQISPDRRVAIALVGLDGDMAQRAKTAEQLQDTLAATDTGAVQAALTGYSPIQNDATALQEADLKRAEAIGIPVALLILVLALGALAAAAVPIGTALAGVLFAIGALYLLSSVTAFDTLVMSMATMIGIGVGIDYAMFIVSRFREELVVAGVVSRDDRDGIAAAVGHSMSTAGKTILASGLVVVISLSALGVMNAPVFRGIAVGVGVAVLGTLIVGLTLLPALLAVLGPAVNRGALPSRWRPAEVTGDPGETGTWARWARTVMAKPLRYGGLAVGVLVLAAMPIFGIRYGLDMGTSALDEKPSGRATTALTANFPAGTLAAIEVVATGPGDTPLTPAATAEVNRFLVQVGGDDRVEAVLPAQQSSGRLLAGILPGVAFDSAEAETLVRDLRSAAADISGDGGPQVLIGGSTAEFVDLSDEMTSKLPLVLALVLGFSLLFLLAAFRSIALPIKAILMNLLATGAALGLTVAVFQWGVGESVLGFTSPGFLQVYLPTVVFAILFGLSMDYEVFLIRRMREYWDTGHDNEYAVAAGLTHTARPITAAAAIMVVVFGSFVTADILELKQLGFALAVAVAIDAIIVRLILVPALMRVLGRWNWWFPTGGRTPAAVSATRQPDSV